jgi:tetratricopeptide (TPR) repeat protein
VLEYAKGELANAQRRLEECLRIRTALRGPDHEDLTIPLDNLARLAQARRDFTEAERLDREALRIDLLTRGKDHPQYIRHLHNLATTLHDRGDLDGAEPLYRQTVDLLRQVLGRSTRKRSRRWAISGAC